MNDAAVRQLLGSAEQLPQPADPAVDEVFRPYVEAVGEAVFEDLPHGRAGLHLLRRQPVHLGVALVADDQPLLAVEHGEALRHVVQGGVELLVLVLQLLLQSLLLGNIVQRHDPAAIRPGLKRG